MEIHFVVDRGIFCYSAKKFSFLQLLAKVISQARMAHPTLFAETVFVIAELPWKMKHALVLDCFWIGPLETTRRFAGRLSVINNLRKCHFVIYMRRDPHGPTCKFGNSQIWSLKLWPASMQSHKSRSNTSPRKAGHRITSSTAYCHDIYWFVNL